MDYQFFKAGFDEKRIFATQGDYGKIQCEKGGHNKTYDAKTLFYQMESARKDCQIPSALVPKCPVCGKNMTMHLRCDQYFVEDENWHIAAKQYQAFLQQIGEQKTVLLELGVGFNTPGIIKYPFWQITADYENTIYICINFGEAFAPEEIKAKSVCINGDIGEILNQLQEV